MGKKKEWLRSGGDRGDVERMRRPEFVGERGLEEGEARGYMYIKRLFRVLNKIISLRLRWREERAGR